MLTHVRSFKDQPVFVLCRLLYAGLIFIRRRAEKIKLDLPHQKFLSRRAFFMASFGSAVLLCLSPHLTESARANGDTRTIYLYHTHTGESIAATFRKDGQYDSAVLHQLNHFLRDWRNNDEIAMDARLFDVIWETYRESGSREPIQIVSAYRSPVTNAMLRRRSKGVAEHSQHMLGKAMDLHYVDVPMSKIREIGMRLERGGVGYYPSAGTPFVHLDVGSVRYWPRMSYDQLARLFPDGKSVFLAADGRTLPHYEEARAEVEARMQGHRFVFAENTSSSSKKSRGLFASLFGGGEADEEEVSVGDSKALNGSGSAPLNASRKMLVAQKEIKASDPLDANLKQSGKEQVRKDQEILPFPLPRPLEEREKTQEVALADIPLPPLRPRIEDPLQGARALGTQVLASVDPLELTSLPLLPPLPPKRQEGLPSFPVAQTVGIRAAQAKGNRSWLLAARLDRALYQNLINPKAAVHLKMKASLGGGVMVPVRTAARLEALSLALSPQSVVVSPSYATLLSPPQHVVTHEPSPNNSFIVAHYDRKEPLP